MSLNVPLAVSVRNSSVDRDITRQIRDLRFRSVAPGGYANIQTTFDFPLSDRPDEATYYTHLIVRDGRHGGIVCNGRLEDPERTSGPGGQVWGLTAMGPAVHASDQKLPLIYVDRSLERWSRIPNSQNWTTATPDSKTSNPGYRFQYERGSVVTVGDNGGIEYLPIQIAGQKVARIAYTHDVDNADANHRHKVFAINGGSTTASDVQFSAGDGSVAKVVVTDWTNGRTKIQIQLSRTTAGVTITDDVTRVWLTDLAIRAMLLNADGSDKTTGYSLNTVTAEEVVRDLLGRVLFSYDDASAVIQAGTYTIDQLAYPDGITPSQVLADLMAIETNKYWAAWDLLSDTSSLYKFEWQNWNWFGVDYEVTSADGFDSPSSSVDLYNKVNVRYRDAAGQTQIVTRTQTVAELSAAGVTRSDTVDISDELGATAAQAQQYGDLWLADRQYPPNRGSLAVTGPIICRSQGRMVMPWEIRPGRLIRVRELEPTVDGLNASARDGSTVFRIVSMDYDGSTNTARLGLDSTARTSQLQLAQVLSSPALTRRRR